ncbi:MAG: RagB/SusD family nutrient uptake outer membrane protein [Bacteroidota bacterium]|nr:RagB/SusD family nutrient uptake outer membrane protein [Bacteroidota bacterium]
MKRLLYLSCIVTLALMGCSKSFLNKDSLSQIGEANFWKTEQDALLGINGIYDVLQDRILYSGNLNGNAGLPMYDNFGDNCYNSYKFEGPGNYMIANVNPTTGMFSDLWASSYKGIARANTAIENISKIPAANISDVKKKALLGQAYFLRGLFYMNLAVYFKDVPLILKVQTLDESYVAKNTYQEVSAQIVTDLKAAADALPTVYPSEQYGYATKGAALGLLARFYMYNKDYQNALDATTAIMALGYSLNPSYSQLFTEAGEYSKEIIFSVRFNQDATQNGETFSGTYAGIPKVDEQPMPNLVKDYYCTDGLPITKSPLYTASKEKLNRDPRLTASVYFASDTFLIDTKTIFKGNTATKYGLRKYLRNSASSTGVATFSPGGQDFIVIRYADILLMRAEALVELNQLTEVYSLVNQVRARVGMPTVEKVEGTGLSQTALRTIVRHERRVELACEGLRFFDLKRWGTVQQAFTTALNDKVAGYFPSYSGPKSESFPIPQSELDANANLTQNPDWQ